MAAPPLTQPSTLWTNLIQNSPMNSPIDSPIHIPATLRPAADCLKDKVILVTGASGSLGRVAALAFAAYGATVVLHGRSATTIEPLYDEIETAGGTQPAMLSLDFLTATESEYQGMANTIHATFKRLDGIFHAAAHCASLTPLALQDLACWNAHHNVNFMAPMALTRACLPMLKRAPLGRVVFLSETHARSSKAFWGAFSVSKSSLHRAAAIWNDELEHESVLRMQVLIPGPVASQCRSVTHPGEMPSQLPKAETLVPAFLLLMSADSRLSQATVYGVM